MSIDNKKMQQKGSFLVYKGVALMVDTDMGTMKMKLTGEKIEENPAMPSAKFEVPEDIKIEEVNKLVCWETMAQILYHN